HHQSSQLVIACRGVVAQHIEDQGKLPQREWVIESPQLSPRDCPLDTGLEGGRLGDAPGKPGQGREDQHHQAVRSAAPLRMALLRAATSRPPLLWKKRLTS